MDEMFVQMPNAFMHLGTGPGAINDFHNHSNGYNSRRNQMTNNQNNSSHNYQSYQFQHQSRREPNARPVQSSPQPSNNANTSANSTTGARELPPRFQRQQQHQQQQQSAPAVTNAVNVNQVTATDPTVKPLTSLANNFDSNDISLRPAVNSILSKPVIPLTRNSMTNSTNIQNNNIMNNSKPFEQNIITEDKPNKTVKNINESNKTTNNSNQSNKEAILKKTEDTLQELLSDKQNIDYIINKFKEMKIPKK